MKRIIMIVGLLLLGVFLIACQNDTPITPTKEIYQVKFLDFDENVLKEDNVEEGSNATLPQAPEVEGYTFDKWEGNYTNIQKNEVIKAVYTVNKYTLTFVDNLENEISTQEVEHGKNGVYPETPELDGYSFLEWEGSVLEVKENRTIIAIYNVQTFTVVFLDNEGNELKRETVDFGKSATAPTAPEIEGKEFVSWDKAFSEVKTNLEVKPIYQNQKYTVSFVSNLGTNIETQEVEYGQNATLPTEVPVIEGYDFVEWQGILENVTENRTITAVYEKQSFTVEFKYEDGRTIETKTVFFNESVEAPDVEERLDEVFVRWDKELITIKENTVITAIYETKTFEVKFVDDDNTLISKQTVNYGESALLPGIPGKIGTESAYWDGDHENITQNTTIKVVRVYVKLEVSFVLMPDLTITSQTLVEYGQVVEFPKIDVAEDYIVRWQEEPRVITEDTTFYYEVIKENLVLTFLYDDGTLIGEATVPYGSNYQPNFEVNVPEGQTLIGWTESLENIQTDLTLRPIFGQSIITVTLYNFPFGYELLVVQVPSGTIFTDFPEITEVFKGYVYVGWQPSANIGKPLYEDTRYYAVYEEIPITDDVNIIFKDADGTILREQLIIKAESFADQIVSLPTSNQAGILGSWLFVSIYGDKIYYNSIEEMNNNLVSHFTHASEITLTAIVFSEELYNELETSLLLTSQNFGFEYSYTYGPVDFKFKDSTIYIVLNEKEIWYDGTTYTTRTINGVNVDELTEDEKNFVSELHQLAINVSLGYPAETIAGIRTLEKVGEGSYEFLSYLYPDYVSFLDINDLVIMLGDKSADGPIERITFYRTENGLDFPTYE